MFFETDVFSYIVVLASILVQLAIRHLPRTRRPFDMGSIPFGTCLANMMVGLIHAAVLELGTLRCRAVARVATGLRAT